MLRRRPHARSRSGCITCKERHVRCDERRPFCRNCVRLGRQCIFSGEAIAWIEERPEIPPVAMSQDVWAANNPPRQHAVYYCAPHHQNISSQAISIVQQSHAISIARPMPRSCLSTISNHYVPKYNQIAARHSCAKYALVSFAAYTHYQATKSAISEEVCISHATVALRELQKEIDHFGPSNADAVVVASVALASATQDWEQWAIFVNGYSKALTQIKDSNFPTVFPDLLGERFELRQLHSMSDLTSLDPPRDREAMIKRVQSLIHSITDMKEVIGEVKWCRTGFGALEKLAETIHSAISLTDDVETYHQLAWLRSWMFWIDLRQTRGGKEESILTGCFYALLLAITPIFPYRYQESLAEVCRNRIQAVRQVTGDSALVQDEVEIRSK